MASFDQDKSQQVRKPPMPPVPLNKMRSSNEDTASQFLSRQGQIPRSARYGDSSNADQPVNQSFGSGPQAFNQVKNSTLTRQSSQPRVALPSSTQSALTLQQSSQQAFNAANLAGRKEPAAKADPTLPVAQVIAAHDSSQKPNDPVMTTIRVKTLLLEYQLLQKYAPVGVNLMPASPVQGDIGPQLMYWKGVYFCKQGIYSDAVLKFKMTFPPEYPKVMPFVHFQSRVFHPLVDPVNGMLKLDRDFGDWQFSKNWLIQVLLFIKKIFHLEKYYSLDNVRENALNRKAFDLYHSNFEAFVDRCIECVERSIDDKFSEDPSQVQLSKFTGTTEAIQAKIQSFQTEGNDLRTKEQLKNYFKQNLPDQLKASEFGQGLKASQPQGLAQMSVMTTLQSRVVRD